MDAFSGPETRFADVRPTQTQEILVTAIRKYRHSRQVIEFSRAITSHLEGFEIVGPVIAAQSEVAAIHNLIAQNVRYVNDPTDAEMTQSPELLISTIAKNGRASGDCDDMTILAGSCLASLGFSVGVVIAGFREKGRYTHVFCVVKGKGLAGVLAIDPSTQGKTDQMLQDITTQKVVWA